MSILCYHAVQPGWSAPMAMEPGAFELHCAWLARSRNVVPLANAVESSDGRGRLPRNATALTFDDGFSGLHRYALPILTRHRLPATVFLVAGTLHGAGQPVDWVDIPASGPLATLTPDQVLEMQEQGVVFESHSSSHADLTTLSFDECVRDLRDSRELLESLLGRRVTMLAYPRGRHNPTVRAAAERAGYSYAFSLPEGPEPVGPYSLPRVGVYRGNGIASLRLKSAQGYLPIRTSRPYSMAGTAVHRARSLVR